MAQLKREALLRLCRLYQQELELATPNLHFGRLKDSFRYRILPDGRATVFSLYYWATFVDQGRSAIEGRLMFFFKNPTDDPRVQSDYPRKISDRKRLQRLQDRGLLIVARQVSSAPGYHFVRKATRAVRPQATKQMLKLMGDQVKSILRSTRGRGTQKLSIRLG